MRQFFEILGGGFRLLGKLAALVGRRAIAAAGHHQRAGALGVGKAEMQRGEAAHRQADDVRLVDLERVEHRADVVACALLRIALAVLGHVGWRIAARVIGDAAIALAEIPHLQFVRAPVAGEFVDEDDRDAAADFLVKQLNPVVGCQVRHRALEFESQKLKLRAETPASMMTTEPLL